MTQAAEERLVSRKLQARVRPLAKAYGEQAPSRQLDQRRGLELFRDGGRVANT